MQRPSGLTSPYGFGQSRQPRCVNNPSEIPLGIPYYIIYEENFSPHCFVGALKVTGWPQAGVDSRAVHPDDQLRVGVVSHRTWQKDISTDRDKQLHLI